jgi:DNA-binding NarL/FixJ family response regulator
MQTETLDKIKIGLVDDHQLFSKSLGLLLSSFANVEVVMDAVNGKDLQEKMATAVVLPQIMLIDVSMPIMDGPQTADWLRITYPSMKLIALSMDDKEETIIRMLKAGCCSYLFKDIHPKELENALEEVYRNGFYNPAINYQKLIDYPTEDVPQQKFSEKELEFLRLTCSELPYKEVASIMNLSERTIEGYRAAMFEKLKVQSRTGMVLVALRRGLVKL